MPGTACNCILRSAEECVLVGSNPEQTGRLEAWRVGEGEGEGERWGVKAACWHAYCCLCCFSLSCLAVGVFLSVCCILLLRGDIVCLNWRCSYWQPQQHDH